MAHLLKHYHWQWHLQSSPEDLWPLVADTNRFDREAGTPAIVERAAASGSARQRIRMVMFGVPMDYVQEPFEWTYPRRFGVVRRFTRGPLAELRVLAELSPQPDGGTLLDYHASMQAANLLGRLAIPVQARLFERSFGKGFRTFDRLVATGKPSYLATTRARLAPGGEQRLNAARRILLDDGADPALLNSLVEVVTQADPITLSHLRPYALADHWRANRQDVLKLCLVATRHGLLNLRWDLLCPSCRAAKASLPTLGGITRTVHCEMCNIDFTANFERSVELTFFPNPAIREAQEVGQYCVGTPQDTPHVVVQQLLAPGESRAVTPVLEPGRYRVRTLTLPGSQSVAAGSDGAAELALTARPLGWPDVEPSIAPTATLTFANETGEEQLLLFERAAWTDQAATAAEVTMLQLFRDLFANEALRPGEQISVGKLAILFTDLRGSTRLYREIGDAPAFGLVMDHFDVLRDTMNEAGGVIVKTLGDSVMAAFQQPVDALRAALRAQRLLVSPTRGRPPFSLKAGIHYGPCIAVTLNDRLDYFGSTVNIASRLESLSQGDDVIVSAEVYGDPEVDALLADPSLSTNHMKAVLKGFDQEHFDLCSVKLRD